MNANRFDKISGGLALVMGTLLSATAFGGTWTLQNSGGGGSATAVAIVDDTHAVAYGLAQQPGSDDAVPMWMRTNDGTNWNPSPAQGKMPGDLLMISSMVCPTKTKCMAAASSLNMQSFSMSNAILKSTDGGNNFTWPPTKQWLNETWAFSNLDYVSDTMVWLSNGPNVAAVKVAGGMYEYQWKVPQVGEKKFLTIVDIDFVDENVGYAVNGKATEGNGGAVTIEPEGALLKTVDGGATWTLLYDLHAELAADLQVLSPSLLFLSGKTSEGPFFRRSEDGGQTWTELVLPGGEEDRVWKAVDAYRAFDRDTAYVIVGVPVGQGRLRPHDL